ncbi:MAG TPA: tyrosine-type recombinase/integrase, partial [Terriglobales bacterium]
MNRTRHPPLLHPLVSVFDRALDSVCAALGPESHRHYRGTVRNFLRYLGTVHPKLNSLEQLRREPHLLSWMSHLRSQKPPLATSSYINRLIALRPLLIELAWTEQLPQLARLIRREDIPRLPQRLARPLTAEQDQLLQQELVQRNDWESNAFLLIRHTGMRIGECADLSFDCLRCTGPEQWAIHVPLGKLKTERMVPVDSLVVTLVQRLRFFRFLDPRPPDGRLLARRSTRDALVRQLRFYLHHVCSSLGLSPRIVPHQLRHYSGLRTMPGEVEFSAVIRPVVKTSPGIVSFGVFLTCCSGKENTDEP